MATARKLPSGNWRVNQYIDTVNGRRLYKSFTAPTKKDAEYDAAEYVKNYKRMQEPANLTVGEAIDRYIAARTDVLSPSTIRGYKLIRKNYLPGLMLVSLKDLTQEAVQREINSCAKKQSPKTLRNAHGLLSATLEAYFPDLVLRTKLPQKTRCEIEIPENADIDKLMRDTRGSIMETVIVLAAFLGLRRSEICALTWDDVNLENKTIRINKALVRNSDNGWSLKAPKSYAGARTFEMPDIVIEHLKSLPHEVDRIVPIDPGSVGYRFTRLVRRLGLTMRLHDLRHYNASVMLALNIPDRYAMERMGHATTNMLKTVYQHVMREKRDEVTQQINEFFQTVQHEMQHEMQHEK